MALEVPPPEALPESARALATAGLTGSRAVSLVLLVISVSFAVLGQLTLKSAMDDVGHIGREDVKNPIATILRAASEPKLWIGLAIFGVSAAFWIVVLSRVALTVAYPMVGLSYVVVVMIGRYYFHEHVPPLRWIGVSVVACGIALIGLSFGRSGAGP